ncbi:uroporphyrinogen-III C-methyltransferase [Oligella ureolytica]
MGSLKAATIQEQLIVNGRAATTPVAIISGTTERQEVATGVLSELNALAATAPRPSLIVIGEVVSLRKDLAWYQEKQVTIAEAIAV